MDQDVHEDHADTATRDKGDGAENIPVEEIQPRPRKPPDTGCIILKRINPGVLMNPMIMMSVPVLMDTSGYDNGLNDV